MLPKTQDDAYNESYKSVRYNKILEQKTTLMLHMATAMAIGCYPWMEHYLGVAKENGITDDEIGAIQAVISGIFI